VTTGDIGLLLNAGLYRERILGEPALAALLQADVGANPEDPHGAGHGTFSFDVANGACGPLTALHIADGFLRAGTVEHALVVASDVDPGRGLAPTVPVRGERRRSRVPLGRAGRGTGGVQMGDSARGR
jgi:3-oxoacyl-[acyl-carrier-protein] synthase-3